MYFLKFLSASSSYCTRCQNTGTSTRYRSDIVCLDMNSSSTHGECFSRCSVCPLLDVLTQITINKNPSATWMLWILEIIQSQLPVMFRRDQKDEEINISSLNERWTYRWNSLPWHKLNESSTKIFQSVLFLSLLYLAKIKGEEILLLYPVKCATVPRWQNVFI